jgi:hypothetical protein
VKQQRSFAEKPQVLSFSFREGGYSSAAARVVNG